MASGNIEDDPRKEGLTGQVGHDDLGDPTAEGSDHACQQVMGKGPRHLKVLEAHGDGVGLGNTDHDGQVALASSFLEDDDTVRGEKVLANAFHNHFDGHLAHPSQSPVTEYASKPSPPHHP